MAATSKTYLDFEGLKILAGKIKNHIKVEADTKIQKIEYDSNNKQLKCIKGDSTFTNIDVGAWVSDIYLQSINLTPNTGEITLKLNNNETKSIYLNEWFDPNAHLTTSAAEGIYLKKDTAEDTYLTISSANTHYVTEIATLTSANIEAAWNSSTT